MVDNDPSGDHDHLHRDLDHDHHHQAAGSHICRAQHYDDHASDGTCTGASASAVHGLKEIW
jgi:hypothetical protein